MAQSSTDSSRTSWSREATPPAPARAARASTATLSSESGAVMGGRGLEGLGAQGCREGAVRAPTGGHTFE